MSRPMRYTTQPLPPSTALPFGGGYEIYPSYPVGAGQIGLGYRALAQRLAAEERVIIDGMAGVLWDDFRHQLTIALRALGVAFDWLDVSAALRPEGEIDMLIAPFLGGRDPLFGTRSPHPLRTFLAGQTLADLARQHSASRRALLFGTGAALAPTEGFLVYVDVPKNEIQYRARAGSITNLGARRPDNPSAMYKRFYFVDWPALRRHQADLLPRMDLIVDSQRTHEPAFMSGAAFRAGLAAMARSWFRARPWFAPGPWGGQWMKRRFPGLSDEAPNLAWSFELVTPENGIALESDGRLLEASLDFLMFHDARCILGNFAERFGCEFPIRFDYLDTFEGGHLSVQCHPTPQYAWRHFGERYTQDETYYITDCAPSASVFLGLREGVDRAQLENAAKVSSQAHLPLDVERFVQKYRSRRHSLYLIPSGTIHCSGRDNLVLEISATPYLYTFKIYDWLRPDLDGQPRPINLKRAMDNLNFERQGDRVREELIARPRLLARREDCEVIHLPTHRAHFYDVHRLEFHSAAEVRTEGSPHVLNLVDGPSLVLETPRSAPKRFAFAETFVVPAATGSYRLISDTGQRLRVVKAFLKPEADTIPEYLVHPA